MTWPFVGGALLVLAVIIWVMLENRARHPVSGDQLYIIMWNDAVVGLTDSRDVAQEFCEAQNFPDEGHYVRWIPMTLNGKFQVFQHKGNNWGRPRPQARSYPL